MFKLQTIGTGTLDVRLQSKLFRALRANLGCDFQVHENDLPWGETSGYSGETLQNTY